MSLESINSHILDKAIVEADKIMLEATKEKEKIISEAKKEADKIYEECLSREKDIFLRQKHKAIVDRRLEAKKSLLKAKQELINEVFEKIKHEIKEDKFVKFQVYKDKTKEIPEDINFYLTDLKLRYETGIANILFS